MPRPSRTSSMEPARRMSASASAAGMPSAVSYGARTAARAASLAQARTAS